MKKLIVLVGLGLLAGCGEKPTGVVTTSQEEAQRAQEQNARIEQEFQSYGHIICINNVAYIVKAEGPSAVMAPLFENNIPKPCVGGVRLNSEAK